MLDFPPRGHQLVLIFTDQPIARHGFEVRYITHRADVTPCAFHGVETLEKELVCHVRENSTDVDIAYRARFHTLAERCSHHLAVVSKSPSRITIGPSGFEQKFLKTDPPSELLGSNLKALLGNMLLDVHKISADITGGL